MSLNQGKALQSLKALSEIKSDLREQGLDSCVYFVELARLVIEEQLADRGVAVANGAANRSSPLLQSA